MASTGHSCNWLKALHLSWDKSDVKIQVLTEDDSAAPTAIFPAHSLVLRCQSSVFDVMLSTDSFLEGKTGEITLQGFSARAGEYFLRFLYLGSLPDIVNIAYIIELLKMSHMYQTMDLFLECSKRLCTSIKINNVCQIYQTAVCLEAEALREQCHLFIKENLNIIWTNDLFHGVKKDLVYEFICADSTKENSDAYWRFNNYISCIGEKWSEDQLQSLTFLQTKGSPYSKGSNPLLQNLYLDRTHNDTVLVVSCGLQTAYFPVHSLVLISQSEVFLQKWKDYEKPRDEPVEINVKDYNPRVVEYLLRYMYTQYLAAEVCEADLMSSLTLALEYKVQDMVTICVDRLTQRLDSTYYFEVLALATRLKLDVLRVKCLDMFKSLEQPFKVMIENCLHYSLDQEDAAQFYSNGNYNRTRTTEVPPIRNVVVSPFNRHAKLVRLKRYEVCSGPSTGYLEAHVPSQNLSDYLQNNIRDWARWRLTLCGNNQGNGHQLNALVQTVSSSALNATAL